MRTVFAHAGFIIPALAGFLPGQGLRVVQLTSGYNSSCAIFSDGSAKCWGLNQDGEVGLGDTTNRGDAPNEMGANLPFIDLGAQATITQIVIGESHACALLSGGSVKCWGANGQGQLGYGDTNDRGIAAGQMGDSLPSVDLGSGRSALQIAAGGRSNCAILDDHSLKCWGDNSQGELGIGTAVNMGSASNQMGDHLPAVDLGTGRTAIQIAGGDFFFCALLDDHGTKCWGANDSGQLGLGDATPRGSASGQMGDALPELSLGTERTAVTLAPASDHTCAQLDTGDLKCWGGNNSGELGLGDVLPRGIASGQMGDALPVVSLDANLMPSGLSCNSSTCCVVYAIPGTLQCWGDNNNGQLGLGDSLSRGTAIGQMGDYLPLVDLGPYARVVSVSVGDQFTCALLADATVRCWGDQAGGELGLGTTVNKGDLPGTMGAKLPPVLLE